MAKPILEKTINTEIQKYTDKLLKARLYPEEDSSNLYINLLVEVIESFKKVKNVCEERGRF